MVVLPAWVFLVQWLVVVRRFAANFIAKLHAKALVNVCRAQLFAIVPPISRSISPLSTRTFSPGLVPGSFQDLAIPAPFLVIPAQAGMTTSFDSFIVQCSQYDSQLQYFMALKEN